MTEKIFELKDVHYSYLGKIPALCGVDLEIEKGAKIAIIGANGSGKSTLLYILDGLLFADKGRVTAFGQNLTEELLNDAKFSGTFRKKVGYVFQNPDVQLFCPDVWDEVTFGPAQLDLPREEIQKRAEKMLKEMGIEHLKERLPYDLSAGEKKKVAIASILAVDPEVLLLDEPTAGLDPRSSRHLVEAIFQAHEKGKTVITSTHDMHILPDIADIIYVMSEEKKVVSFGPAAKILQDKELLEKHNLIHIHAHRHTGMTHAHPHLHLDQHDHDHV